MFLVFWKEKVKISVNLECGGFILSQLVGLEKTWKLS